VDPDVQDTRKVQGRRTALDSHGQRHENNLYQYDLDLAPPTAAKLAEDAASAGAAKPSADSMSGAAKPVR
jgi:hypothetical protein